MEPIDGHAAQAAELSIVFAAGFDRDLLTAITVIVAAITNPAAKMIMTSRFPLLRWLFFMNENTIH
jgi:hypothetical protein